jgi:hypothetical protein
MTKNDYLAQIGKDTFTLAFHAVHRADGAAGSASERGERFAAMFGLVKAKNLPHLPDKAAEKAGRD